MDTLKSFENLYVFSCGCSTYELIKRDKYKCRWVCPNHPEAGLKEIHGFCEECGLNFIAPGSGSRRRYCHYETRFLNSDGSYSLVKGCAGIRARLKMRHRNRGKSTTPRILNKPKIIKKVYEPVIDIATIMRSWRTKLEIPHTPFIDSYIRCGIKN